MIRQVRIKPRFTRQRQLILTTAAFLCFAPLSSATVLILDSNGNYIDAKTLQSGATPYAAPEESAPKIDTNPLAEEGIPFPDPNAAVATDPARIVNPASNYDIILRETRTLAQQASKVDETVPDIPVGTEDASQDDIGSSLSEAPELETAETGGLVFATIFKTDSIVEIFDPELNVTSDAPVVLQAMPAFASVKDEVEDPSVFSGPKTYDSIIKAEVAKFDNVDFPFVKAVIAAESNYNMTAVSPKGAMGLMQIMPSTAETYGVINPFSPEENIRAGTAELSRLMTVYSNPTLALAGYNAGQGAVEKHNGVPPFRETQEYIVRVLTKTFEGRQKLASQSVVEEKAVEPKADPLMRPLSVQTFDW